MSNSFIVTYPRILLEIITNISSHTFYRKTSDLIPLCHPLPIDKVHIDIQLIDNRAIIECECRVTHKTGVEMEVSDSNNTVGVILSVNEKQNDELDYLIYLYFNTGSDRSIRSSTYDL